MPQTTTPDIFTETAQGRKNRLAEGLARAIFRPSRVVTSTSGTVLPTLIAWMGGAGASDSIVST